MKPILETHRLLLRELSLEDHESMHAILSDPIAIKHYPKPFDLEMSKRWITWSLENYERHGFGLWGLVLKESGRLIGDCGLTIQMIDGVGELEIGYHVARAHWGQGYATEAAAACRDHVFEVLRRDRVVSWMGPANTPSRRVAEKIGMTLKKQPMCSTGNEQVVYSLNRDAWIGTASRAVE